jgi:hypothetical protein
MNSSNQKSPLRWFLLLWLGLVYVQSLQTAMQNLNPGPKVPLPGTLNSPQLDLVSFTILVACHGGLHWIAFSLRKTWALLLYFLGREYLCY